MKYNVYLTKTTEAMETIEADSFEEAIRIANRIKEPTTEPITTAWYVDDVELAE